MDDTERVAVLIVGAGPAGLAAAEACRLSGTTYMAIEAGSSVANRDHADHRSLTVGVGGAGLFSDGKFSFYPSATRLWSLIDSKTLRAGYLWLSRLASRWQIVAPPFPEEQTFSPKPLSISCGQPVARKEYPSFYMPLPDRIRLISELETACGDRLRTAAFLNEVDYHRDRQTFECTISDVASPQKRCAVVANAIVFAGGRFGSCQPRLFDGLEQIFRRVEVGFRIEQDSPGFFLNGEDCLDPKLLVSDPDARFTWRTFCCCRKGEVVCTSTSGFLSVSGRGDGLDTGRSNVGFNLVVNDPALGTTIWRELEVIGADCDPERESARAFLSAMADPTTFHRSRLSKRLGITACGLPATGLQKLLIALKQTPDGMSLIAPSVEGVGLYPSVDEDLRIPRLPFWVAGDSTGIFRGLTAALVSGYYAGTQAARQGAV